MKEKYYIVSDDYQGNNPHIISTESSAPDFEMAGPFNSLIAAQKKLNKMTQGDGVGGDKELSDYYWQKAEDIDEEINSDRGGETSGTNWERIEKLEKKRDKFREMAIKYDKEKMATGGNVEKGSAHIYIDLSDGDINVYHGDSYMLKNNPTILLEIKNAKEGSWNKIWETLNDIKSLPIKEKNGSAHIYIDLSKGNITVYHGDSVEQINKPQLLMHIENVSKNSWDKIWKTLSSFKMANGGGVGKMAMSYKLNSNDKHNIDAMYFSNKDKMTIGELKQYISDKLKINYFEVSSYMNRNNMMENGGSTNSWCYSIGGL